MSDLPPKQRQAFAYIGHQLEANGVEPSLQSIAAHLGVHRTTARAHLVRLAEKGLVYFERYGRPLARLTRSGRECWRQQHQHSNTAPTDGYDARD